LAKGLSKAALIAKIEALVAIDRLKKGLRGVSLPETPV
jgi:hypothetical protein